MKVDYYKFVEERLSLFDDVIKHCENISSGKLWKIEPSYARFHLGESISDLKIPYLMGTDDELIVEKAIAELALLLKKRFYAGAADDSQEEVIDLPVTIKTTVIDRTFRTDIFPLNSPEKIIARDMLLSVPFMDSGIIKYWLAQDGSGKQFMDKAKAILLKSIKEEMGLMGSEKTAYFTLLALINTVMKKKEMLKNIRVKKIGYERLERLIGFSMFFLFASVVNSIEEELKEAKVLYDTNEVIMTLKSCLTPQGFVSISGNILEQDLNPYKIPKDIIAILTPIYETVAHRCKDTSEIIDLMGKGANDDPFFIDSLVKIHMHNQLRKTIIEYLLEYDISGIYVHGLLGEICQNQKTLHLVFNDADFRDKVYKGLSDVKIRFGRDAKRTEAVDQIMVFLKQLSETKFWDWFKIPEANIGEIISDVIKGFVAYKFDEEVERFVSTMRGAVVDKRTDLRAKEMLQDYERGRLYRFSFDDRPILNTAASALDGLLFVDMKDFTRKTFKVKEVSMAEFMKDDFYTPILEASKKYGASGGVSAVHKGIQIENFLGDAAIFSGSVANLISFATDIQKIMRSYKEKLKKRFAGISQDAISAVQKKYENDIAEIKKQEKELAAAIEKGDRIAEIKLVKLKNREASLEKAHRAEVENIEAGMDAGLFISYGTKPETIVINDDYWGTLKVAIGEKINEAARGTTRNSAIKTKREILLEREKDLKGNPNLEYPFDVFIDKTYSLFIPPEIDAQIDDMIMHKDLDIIEDIAKIVANDCYDDLKKIVNREPISSAKSLSATSDIYNKGQALTDAALEAYMQETKTVKVFFKKEPSVSELHQDIQSRFFFPEDKIELWFGIDVSGKMDTLKIFSRCGTVTFKGFEAAAPTVVYEILDTSSDFFNMLVKHNFHDWFEEARNQGRERAQKRKIAN